MCFAEKGQLLPVKNMNWTWQSFLTVTTGFYLTKLDEIGYQVCFSSWRDVYETIQNPEFRNPAIGGV